MRRTTIFLIGFLLLAAGSVPTMKPENLLENLNHVRKTKDGWIATCPAHADKTPSLSIGVGQEGQILLRCFAGCTPEAIVEALGLRMKKHERDKRPESYRPDEHSCRQGPFLVSVPTPKPSQKANA